MAQLEVDYMEYSSDALAQAAWISNGAAGFTSQYPPVQSDDYVKVTSKYSTNFWPYYATDPTKSLTGDSNNNSWATANTVVTNQRFHIDLGSAKVATRIYYENGFHLAGYYTDGVKNFTIWGSNEATAFAELTYGTDTNWTQITPSQSTFDQHIALDQADPKYITLTNSTAYRYYAFKFADNYGGSYMRVRRITLQTGGVFLQCYSENTIKVQGSYALKGVATATSSLNKTLTRTIASPYINLSDKEFIKIYLYSSRTGANIKFSFHDTGGTTTEITPTIVGANAWEVFTLDLYNVTNANKDAIDTITITITNADADNTFYVDYLFSDIFYNFLMTGRGRHRMKRGGVSYGNTAVAPY